MRVLRVIIWILGLFFMGSVMAEELTVLSFNTWGIKGAKYRKERMTLIVGAVSELNPDIIVFQEVFENWEAEILKKGLARSGYLLENMRHFSFPKSSTGMMVVSRYPIVDERFKPYFGFDPDSGKEKIIRAQASFLIDFKGKKILFITSHIMPRILPTWIKGKVINYDINQVEQILEFYQLAEFTAQEQREKSANTVIVAGDLNADPCLISYQLFLSLTGLKDAYTYLYPDKKITTYSPKDNPFAVIASGAIDHILFGNFSSELGLVASSAKVLFNQPYKSPSGKSLFLSDHFGIWAKFSFEKPRAIIKNPAIIWEKSIDDREKAELISWLESEKDIPSNLAIKLGMAVLSQQVVVKKRNARLTRAGAKIIVSANKDLLNSSERKALLRWLKKL